VTPGIPYEIEKGAAGKVILAFLPAGEAQKIVAKLRKNSSVNIDRLLTGIEETKKKGYSFTMDERGSGVVGFAAPILGPDREFLGGIGIAIPIIRYRSNDHNRYADVVKACAGEISSFTQLNLEKERRQT
jgi:DNA-binding IclR family transcriptional regulator